jgi:hypothetical protein
VSNGAASNAYSDLAVDGAVESVSTTFTDLITDIAVAAGQTLEIYGVYGDCDKAAFFRVIVEDATVLDQTYLLGQCFEARAYNPQIPSACPIVITGGADITVNVQARVQQGADGSASATLFARLIS